MSCHQQKGFQSDHLTWLVTKSSVVWVGNITACCIAHTRRITTDRTVAFLIWINRSIAAKCTKSRIQSIIHIRTNTSAVESTSSNIVTLFSTVQHTISTKCTSSICYLRGYISCRTIAEAGRFAPLSSITLFRITIKSTITTSN